MYTINRSRGGSEGTLPMRSLTKWSLALLVALLGLARPVSAQSTRVTYVVQAPLDDMEEYVVGGGVDWNSSDIEMTSEGGGVQIMGFRFTNVAIPQGAVITGAWLQFTADEANTEATALTIRGEATDNSAQYQDAAFTVSSRTRTTASVNWNVPSWSIIQEKGDAQKSSDIKSVVQEIINRGGWSSGNALSIIINGNGKRVAESQEGATSGAVGHAADQACNLIIDYVIPTDFSKRVIASSDDAEQLLTTNAMDLTSSDLELTEDAANQYIGLRWTGVTIPKGAIITSAYVQFATDEIWPNPTSVTMYGFAADNLSTFTATVNDIGSRALTVANAAWTIPDWNVLQEQGANQRTPDLKALIQEIVDRGGWAPGNALGIRISGTGHRTAEAFDGSAPEAPMLVVKYYTNAPPDVPWGTFPVTLNSTWRYLDNGANLGTSWTATNFNDSTWKAGKPQLGFGDGDEATIIGYGPNANAKYITTYFRHTFTVSSLNSMDSVIINLMRDDGAIVYLNGVEIIRSNMPAGAVSYTTAASSNVGGTDESKLFRFGLPKNVLQIGKNVLAVEIHQDVATSSDLSFALTADGLKNDVKLITAPSSWKFLDNGFYPGGTWATSAYNDAAWKSGNTQFGYGNDGETTKLQSGPNPAFKYITSYFRKVINVADTSGFGSLELKLKADDGAVIYINGAEAYRYNMPSGNIDQLTLATSFVEGPYETQWQTIYLNRALLKPGQNVIAVEVHQNSSTSTDLAFDAELSLLGKFNATSTGTSIQTCTPGSSGTIGCFTSVAPSTKNQLLNFPTKTHTFQVLEKALTSTYTGTNTVLPNGNDFTGYIPYTFDGQIHSDKGWLSINHENTPGGVSMLSMRIDPKTMLWVVDTIRNVDYSPVVQSTRNCSGGISPWGTIFSSEESYNLGDANADGYHDVGWMTEINPVTAKIVDHDGDGKSDKLWSIGRSSRENICFKNDSLTAYCGEDGGTGALSKFVSNQKMNFQSGTLYALKQDAPGSTTGTWVAVPNATQADRNTSSTLAGALGATKFGGIEDVEIGPDGMIYFTEKNLGDIWRFRDNGATVSQLEKYVSTANFNVMTDAGLVSESWQTGNDNLAFDGEGNLWVLQDGGRDHIWVIRPGHTMANPKVELFATTPEGCEPTGITFSPDYRYLFISMQNPSSTNTAAQIDATGKPHVWNASMTLVIARRESLGAEAMVPAVELGNDIYRCVGDAVTLSYADKNAQNIWSVRTDNSTSQQVVSYDSTLTVKKTSMVYLTSIGNNGLTKSDSVKVTFTELPVVNLGPDITVCPGDEVTLNAGTFSSYIWEDTRTTSSTRTVSQPGYYWVTVTSPSGCTASDTILIKAETGTAPNLGENLRICQGSTAVLSPGGGFKSYKWNTGDSSSTLVVTQAGKYRVTTINQRGCEASDEIEVSFLPKPDLGPDMSICNGDRVVLNPGAGYRSYEWSSNQSHGQTLPVGKPGIYWVRVTDDQGCTQTDSVEVRFLPAPWVNLGLDTVISDGQSITLDAGDGASYVWSTGQQTRTITVDKTGNYSVTVTNSFGCESSDAISVIVAPVAGIDKNFTTDAFDIRLTPNPFDKEMTIMLNMKRSVEYSLEVFDLAGRKVTTIGSGVGTIGMMEFTLNAEELGAEGLYILKLTVDGKPSLFKIMRK